ncbi:unnamed protein product [Caenorhabditis angaria]|uniref:Uncharacterized protein n=1 Tax=Caenorhabditis angaria TaxID=860376 RepID=A0A9P1MUI6_9PELO|nr:unnamed protein product [Caenorhabditis angaria]
MWRKTFAIDGVTVTCKTQDFANIVSNLKSGVVIDDSDDWLSDAVVQKYTPLELIEAARSELSKTPQDKIQASKKGWMAAALSIKILFIKSLKLDVTTYNTLSFFAHLSLDIGDLEFHDQYSLRNCWQVAERLHQEYYGVWEPDFYADYIESDYSKILDNVQHFVVFLSNIDHQNLRDRFHKEFPSSSPSLVFRKQSGNIKIGDTDFEVESTAFYHPERYYGE